MKLLPYRTKIVMLSTIATGVTLFVVSNFTGATGLEAVTLDGHPVADYRPALGLEPNRSIFRQPVDSICEALLAEDGIVRVDLDYSLPHSIELATNKFAPACFALDEKSGHLVGLTGEGRVVPIPDDQSDWERPVLTGITAGRLYEFCDDVRVGIVVPQLKVLSDDHTDLFRLITEIDFSRQRYLTVTISGLSYRLKLTAEAFGVQLSEFIKFIERYTPDLSGTSVLDMRFEDMIIQIGEGR